MSNKIEQITDWFYRPWDRCRIDGHIILAKTGYTMCRRHGSVLNGSLYRQKTPPRSADLRTTLVPVCEGLTWTCHACGLTRPDERISVYSRRWIHPSGVSMGENIRYCNDKSECAAEAPSISFVDRTIDDEWREVGA